MSGSGAAAGFAALAACWVLMQLISVSNATDSRRGRFMWIPNVWLLSVDYE